MQDVPNLGVTTLKWYYVSSQVTAMREKNLDSMRPDIVSVLKNSSLAFVRELVGVDPVAVFRWAIVRAFFRYLQLAYARGFTRFVPG